MQRGDGVYRNGKEADAPTVQVKRRQLASTINRKTVPLWDASKEKSMSKWIKRTHYDAYQYQTS